MERDEWKLKIDDEMGNKKENKKKQRKRGNWKIGKDGEEKRKIEMKGSEKNVRKQKDSFRKKNEEKERLYIIQYIPFRLFHSFTNYPRHFLCKVNNQ